MGENMPQNIGGLFLAFVSVLIFFVGLAAVDQVKGKVNAVVNVSQYNNTVYSEVSEDYEDTRDTLVNGINFLLVVVVVFTFYSSFVNKSDLVGYATNFIGGIMIGAFILYIMTSFYNVYTGAVAGLFDLNEIPSWFYDNISNIILMNIVAGALSFIFVRREVSGYV